MVEKLKEKIKRLIITGLVLLFIVNTALGQNSLRSYRGFGIELIGSTELNSARHFNFNENSFEYAELRIFCRVSKYVEVNAAMSYQRRSFIYFARAQNGSEVPLYMKRYYIPGGFNARLYISDFFFEKLRAWKKPDKWDVYLQLGLIRLNGHDVKDEREDEFKNLGYTVPYYADPYVIPYGKKYLAYLLGLRYNVGRKFGIFIEGGEGALTNLQLGCKAQF